MNLDVGLCRRCISAVSLASLPRRSLVTCATFVQSGVSAQDQCADVVAAKEVACTEVFCSISEHTMCGSEQTKLCVLCSGLDMSRLPSLPVHSASHFFPVPTVAAAPLLHSALSSN